MRPLPSGVCLLLVVCWLLFTIELDKTSLRDTCSKSNRFQIGPVAGPIYQFDQTVSYSYY